MPVLFIQGARRGLDSVRRGRWEKAGIALTVNWLVHKLNMTSAILFLDVHPINIAFSTDQSGSQRNVLFQEWLVKVGSALIMPSFIRDAKRGLCI